MLLYGARPPSVARPGTGSMRVHVGTFAAGAGSWRLGMVLVRRSACAHGFMAGTSDGVTVTTTKECENLERDDERKTTTNLLENSRFRVSGLVDVDPSLTQSLTCGGIVNDVLMQVLRINK